MAYNARTGTFALLTERTADWLPRLDHDSVVDHSLADRPPQAVLDNLQRMGFLHGGDERSQVRERLSPQNSSDTLGLTIAPTVACNFDCDYCFQNGIHAKEFMCKEVQDGTVRLVGQFVQSGRRRVSITWYGGEPLLAKETVIEMTQRIGRTVSGEGGEVIDVSMVTNGTMLDRQTAKELKLCGIKYVQVSFDALTYECRKKRGVVLTDGSPSPILRNVLAARGDMSISVRINVSRSNQEEVDGILHELSKHGIDNIEFGRVEDGEYETQCGALPNKVLGDKTGGDVTIPVLHMTAVPMGRAEYADFEKEMVLDGPNGLRVMVERLTPKRGSFCGAAAGAMYVIEPNGNVSRCWLSVGHPNEAMGSVFELTSPIDESGVAKKWRLSSPFAYKTCENCSVLPLCMGGCSHSRAMMDATYPPCESIRHQVQYCVRQLGGRMNLDRIRINGDAVVERSVGKAPASVC